MPLCKGEKAYFRSDIFLKGIPVVTLNCDMMTGEFYRRVYPEAVTRGYHCPPVQQPYFNTINLEKDVTDEELLKMIDHSYSYVVSKLPKKIQQELNTEKLE